MPFRSVKCWSKPFGKLLLVLVAGASATAHAAMTLTPKNKGHFAYFVNYTGVTNSPTFGFDTSDTGDAAYPFEILNLSAHKGSETAGSRSQLIKMEIGSDTVTSAPSSGIYAVTIAASDGTLLPIQEVNNTECTEGTSTGQCQRAGINFDSYRYFFAATFIPGSSVTIGFYPKDICYAYDRQKSSALSGCETDTDGSGLPTFQPVANIPKPLTLTVSIRPLAGAVSESPGTAVDSANVTLGFQIDSPTLTCPTGTTLESLYYPGDGRITMTPLSVLATSTIPTGGAGMEKVIVIGNEVGAAPTFATNYESSNPFVQRANYSDQPINVTGFTNTTDGTDHRYNLGFMLRDTTGQLISSSCTQNNVQTSTIQGILGRSQCFIATAAFRSERAAPVAMLRQFRDEVLSRYEPGREFIEWYYRWSPGAAEWLVENPWFRYPVLVLLMPIEMIAWLLLHPEWLAGIAILSLLGTGLVFLRKRKAWLALLALAWLPTQAKSAQVETPYIDELRQELGEMESAPQGSYIESIKKKLDETPEGEAPGTSSYINELKAEDPEKYAPAIEAPKSYTEEVRGQLEKKEESGAIQAVLEGRSELELKREGDIHNAFGFRYGTVLTRNITVGGATAAQDFDTMYGSNYAPDVTLFYEYQPFHSEWLGNIGVLGMLGGAFYNGNGRFQVRLENPLTADATDFFSEQSNTRFQLYAFPFTLGLNYRFNLFRVLRPFVMAGGTAIGLMELRNDGMGTKFGYSMSATFGGGVSLLLDWFSRASSWDLYSSFGIKHYYLTVDYQQMLPLLGDVRYAVSGVMAGFTFEF